MMNLKKEFDLYLSNLAVMTFKLHNLHWNVTGLAFKSIHEFTEMMWNQENSVLWKCCKSFKKMLKH